MCTSHLQFLLQFSSVIPSSSSPQTSTAEKISATNTAKQHTKAKITMHFCWDCKTGTESNIDFRGVVSILQDFCENEAKMPQPWLLLPGSSGWFSAQLSRLLHDIYQGTWHKHAPCLWPCKFNLTYKLNDPGIGRENVNERQSIEDRKQKKKATAKSHQKTKKQVRWSHFERLT